MQFTALVTFYFENTVLYIKTHSNVQAIIVWHVNDKFHQLHYLFD